MDMDMTDEQGAAPDISLEEHRENNAIGGQVKIPHIFGGLITGPSHVKNNVKCQDAFACKIFNSGLAVIAVSDGLGCASMSDVGAKILVETAVDEAEQLLAGLHDESFIDILIRDVARKARDKVLLIATNDNRDRDDYAGTLIIAIIHGDRVYVGHIGDGGVVGEVDGGIAVISPPGETEYINEVVPITYDQWEDYFRVSHARGVSALAVFTDGCQWASLVKTEDGYRPFDPFFTPIFAYAHDIMDTGEADIEIKELLGGKKMSSGSGDDKTLVISVLK